MDFYCGEVKGIRYKQMSFIEYLYYDCSYLFSSTFLSGENKTKYTYTLCYFTCSWIIIHQLLLIDGSTMFVPIHDWAHTTGPTRLCPDTIVPRHDCAQTRLCTDTIVPRHDCAQTRLCTDTIVPRHDCAQTRLCPGTIVPRYDCAQTRLCPDTFVSRHICVQTHLCPDTFVPKHI